MSKPGQKPHPIKLIMPVLLVLGVLFGLAEFTINIPGYLDQVSTKVSYPTDYEFKIYDRFLKRHVKHGLIDYPSAKGDPDLQAAYYELKSTSPSQLKGKLEQLCFWINTYNLLTIKCITDCYPIRKLGQERASKQFIVGGKLYSLNQISDEVFPELICSSDWRAIFLVCNGTVSSPFIVDHAYSASSIDDEFEPALKRFVLSKVNYNIDAKDGTFSISPFYRTNIRFIDSVYPSPFDMVNDFLPREIQVDLDKAYRNYARPFDWRINDRAWLKELNESSSSNQSITTRNSKITKVSTYIKGLADIKESTDAHDAQLKN